jgi:hypothetical protein
LISPSRRVVVERPNLLETLCVLRHVHLARRRNDGWAEELEIDVGVALGNDLRGLEDV